MSEKQITLASPFTVKGKGLHTGVNVTMTVKPAAECSGIVFCRTDIEGCPIVEALAENVVETSRSTVIAKKDVRISTVEHVLAALWGMGIDNAVIEVDAAEVPINDGSAAKWVEEIQKAGLKEQNADRVYYNISEKVAYQNSERGVEIVAYPDEELSISVNIDFNSTVIGNQYAVFNNADNFAEQVAPCRTFVFLHELEPLINANLIKGGDLDNAIVIVEKPVGEAEAAKIAALCHSKTIETDKKGYLGNISLRFDNEIARHKMLDLMGDLALIGRRINGKIFATRPGHSANTEFSKLIRKAIKRDADKPTYKYDPNAEPVMDINQIKATLPHRPPFLLVDKIMEMSESTIVGVKQVTMNEPFFVGHFPKEPVMPGVLQVEAMAQCGGILALSNYEDPENYSTYFVKIDGVKFKRKVVPGDTLVFVLSFTEPIRRGIVQMYARCYVGDTLATEAYLMAMITKK